MHKKVSTTLDNDNPKYPGTSTWRPMAYIALIKQQNPLLKYQPFDKLRKNYIRKMFLH